ncbi:DNA gyrase subunit A [Deltaproteobacteria bacterium PRO3]|nr:DNA gyrase subunit A [Deltaproteobacteria bacterium PRO3]
MVRSAEIVPINIEDEMRDAYLDYSMSVIIGRALPDVRDGLKPVHRRILYAMFREGLLSNKRFSKCAGVVGEVLKKYHPHGDSAVYDSLVRMAQPWNLRYPLIDGQGNFGSIDGDPAAAYRYTEARLMAIAEEMLADIDKETVDFIPNFDNSTEEPTVLPTRIPNLLINGSDGIAVGMATKIPPHNLKEIIAALLALIEDPEVKNEKLYQLVPGPDFPTGAFIYGRDGIKQAYETGRGLIQMRARANIEPIAKGDKEAIIVSELPFQVNKAKLIEQIAHLVRDGKIEGIGDLRDESDREGMRIVIELKRGTVAGVILNQLYKHTPMQSSFGVILLSIVQGQPRVLGLRDMLQLFLDHRKEVVTRRTVFELRKAEERAHILEGLKIAVENIDEVVAIIKKSKTPAEAKDGLMTRFKLSEVQAQAILDLRLQRLTGLERDKILQEFNEIQDLIKRLKEILASEKLVFKIIADELKEIRDKYGDDRRTEIMATQQEISVEDLIQEEDMVVTVSHNGYIKRNAISLYRAQRRGGRGKTGMTTRDEDFVEDLFVASTHSYVLVFSTKGKVYWLKVHEIPQAGRATKGKAIVNLLNFAQGENLAAILPVREFKEGLSVVMCTRNGTIKKTDLMAFSHPRAGGIIALGIEEGDELIAATLSEGNKDILIGTAEGMTIRFEDQEVREMGRTAYGVRGIKLEDGDFVVGMEVVNDGAAILTVSANGLGKRTPTDEYRVQGRGGVGVITMKVTDKTGKVVAVKQVSDTDEIMLITNSGKIIRMPVNNISIIGRNTQGVRLINLEEGEQVSAVAKLAESEEDEEKETAS